jgi:uncharacterized membrane protein YjgN (DUF898 family)
MRCLTMLVPMLAVVAAVAGYAAAGAASAASAPAPQDLAEMTAEVRTWARWACILAGLALLASLRVSWSLRTLARNQLAISEQIAVGKDA